MLKLTILNDNAPGTICGSEHGLSYIVHADKTLLFDLGPSDIFLKNAQKLKSNIDNIDTIVLSHGHWDHGNGLKYLSNKKLITHPDSFQKKYRKKDNSYIGLPISKEEAQKKFNLILSKTPYNISEQIIFLGEIPRLNKFEAQSTSFVLENGKDDFVMDDSALAIKTKKGLIVVSGCAHSGICNIINYAQKVAQTQKVYGVIGGFHLKENNWQTQKTIECFKSLHVEKIYPAHCTKLPALSAFHQNFKINQVLSGNFIYF